MHLPVTYRHRLFGTTRLTRGLLNTRSRLSHKTSGFNHSVRMCVHAHSHSYFEPDSFAYLDMRVCFAEAFFTGEENFGFTHIFISKDIQSLVGHADIDMTKHCLHIQEPIRQEAIDRFDQAFSNRHGGAFGTAPKSKK